MKRGGYIDPCGIWWALPNAKSSSVTFIQRSRKKLAYKQHILQTHSLSNISIKEVVAGKISIGSKIIEETQAKLGEEASDVIGLLRWASGTAINILLAIKNQIFWLD